MDRSRDDGAAEFERFLLESALEEAPAPELRDRVIATMGAAALMGTAAAGVNEASLSLSGAPAGTAAGGAAANATAGAGTTAIAGGKAAVTASSAVKALLLKGAMVLATTGVATGVVVLVREPRVEPVVDDRAANAVTRSGTPPADAPGRPQAVHVPAETAHETAPPPGAAREVAAPAGATRGTPGLVGRAHKAAAPVGSLREGTPPSGRTEARRPAPPRAPEPTTAKPAPGAEAPASGVAAPVSTGALPLLEAVPAPAPPRASAVASEVAALDRARAALSAGNAAGALHELSRYDAEFPSGALRQEKTVLEVRALLAAGQREKARARVDEFLARNPGTAQRARLRALVE